LFDCRTPKVIEQEIEALDRRLDSDVYGHDSAADWDADFHRWDTELPYELAQARQLWAKQTKFPLMEVVGASKADK
jgi:hypothetical protein